MPMDDAAVNVGNANATMALILSFFGPGSVILNALIAGKTGADATEALKWTIICAFLAPVLGIGYIIGCCIGCKTKKMSE